MKILPLIVVFFALSVPSVVLAEGDSCEGLYEFAQVAMMARQTGKSIVEIKKVIRGNTPDMGDADQAVARAVMMIVLEEAYETPRFSIEKNQIEAIQDFANEKALNCYKGSR